MGVDRAFWRGKRVFVTGHTGFKGGWLSLWLQDMGAELHGFALPPNTEPSLFEIADIGDGMTSTLGDLRDPMAVTSALRQAHPEIVFHLAAQPLVRESYASPIETLATNVMGTAHLLEAARQLNREWYDRGLGTIRAAVIVTSDKCYANKNRRWRHQETDELGGFDPYSGSKACAEIVTAAYRSSYFADAVEPSLAVATARAGNVIGGGDWAEGRIVPDAIRAFASGDTLLVRYPAAVRPWQHVLEALGGYLMLAERLYRAGCEYAGPWNFGPDYEGEYQVSKLVEMMARLWGGEVRWQVDDEPQPNETGVLLLDSSKAQKNLNWRSKLSLEEALALTMEWYLAVHNRDEPPRDLTLRQIRTFAHASRVEADA